MAFYNYNGMGEQYVTFAATDAITVGQVCKISANDTVDACDDGDRILGIVAEKRDGTAGVVIGGYVELPYSGTLSGAGFVKLAADGSGGVKAATGGHEYLVIRVDSAASTVGLFL